MAAEPRRSVMEPAAEARIRALETALAEERQRLADALEVSPGWIWEADSDLRISHLLGRFAPTTGVAEQDWLGRGLPDLLSPAVPDRDSIAEMRARRTFLDFVAIAQSPTGPRHL